MSASPLQPESGTGAVITLVEQIRRRALEDPEAIILKHVDGRELSYAALWDSAVGGAQSLAGLGVTPGDHVATFLSDYFASFANWLAIALLGAVEVPLNPALRADSLLHPITDSAPTAIVTSSVLFPHIEAIGGRLPAGERVVVIDVDEPSTDSIGAVGRSVWLSGAESGAAIAVPEPWDPACIVYTSGTTGRPKGVIIPWGQIAQNMRTSIMMVQGNPGPRYCYAAPFHMSGKYNLAAAVLSRETLVVRDGFSLSQFWSDIRTHGCTYAQLFPQLARLLLAQTKSESDVDNTLSRVVCSPAFAEVDEFKARFGVDRVSSGFGTTEIGGPIANMNVTGADWHTCGKVVDNASGIEVEIVDEHDRPVPRGEAGEIVVRTRAPWALTAGYLGLPEATAASWRNGWFHTGDAARIGDDGNYVFVDRLKDYVRHKGENISSFELESYIQENPAVKEVAVIGVPSDLGEEDIKAVILLEPERALTPLDLIVDLETRVPKFMIPRYVEVVADFPRTAATGRIQKAELKKQPMTSATWDRRTVTGRG